MPSTTLTATGAVQFFTVPDSIDVLAYQLSGGTGTSIASGDFGAPDVQAGGRAAVVQGYLPVTSGERLWLALGQGGGDDTFDRASNGTGSAGGGINGGGAASMLGRGEPSLANALVVAGGGGGGGEDGTGGHAGGIGGAGTGPAGGRGGGQDPTYTSPGGEGAGTGGCGGGGGGLVGGRAGRVEGERRGPGGGGSSKVPSGATVTTTAYGPGLAQLTWGVAPLAPTLLSPAPGEVLAAGRSVTLRHQFNGSGGGDTQTSATITYTTGSGSGSVQLAGTDAEAAIPAALTGPGPVTWSVATRGQGGAEGPAATGSFTIAVAPEAPIITAPEDGQVATGPDGEVTWLASGQAAYRLRTTNADASVVYSEVVVADPSARRAPVTYDQDGRTVIVRLSVRGSNGAWSEEDHAAVPVAWARPATPDVALSPRGATGSIRVAVTHPAEPGRPAVVATTYEAVRMDTGERTPIAVGADEQWWTPASGVQYVITATARDALGVPATGVSPARASGWGRGPWGAGPWGS